MRFGIAPIVASLLVAALAVSACGRKGPLERPPEARTATAEGVAEPARDRRDRPFILDRLLR